MVPALIVTLLARQDNSVTVGSVEEVRKNIYRAVREVRNYRETWLLTTSDLKLRPLTIRRWLDGERYRQEVSVDRKLLFAAGHDATIGWFVSHENRQYVEKREPNSRFEAPYALGAVPDMGEFQVGFVSPYDLDFRANPPFKLQAFQLVQLNGLPARRLDALSRKNPLSYVNLQIHVDQEGWLITRLVINGRRDNGTRFWQEFRLTDRKFGVAMNSEMFHLAPETVKGYERLDAPLDAPLPKGSGSGF